MSTRLAQRVGMVCVLLVSILFINVGNAMAAFGPKQYKNVQILLKQRQLDLAKSLIRDGLKEDATNPWVHLALGYVKLSTPRKRSIQEGRKEFEWALEGASDNQRLKKKIQAEINSIIINKVILLANNYWFSNQREILGEILKISLAFDMKREVSRVLFDALDSAAKSDNPDVILMIYDSMHYAAGGVDYNKLAQDFFEVGIKKKDENTKLKYFRAVYYSKADNKEEFLVKIADYYLRKAQKAHAQGLSGVEKGWIERAKFFYYFGKDYNQEFFEQYFPPPRTVWRKVISRTFKGKGFPKFGGGGRERPFVINVTETGREPGKVRKGDKTVIKCFK
ncbi:hypothetical protein D6821_00300, partial [Candidatus Parcubacteria bacterium]